MSILKLILKIANYLKPILLKIFPQKIMRDLKGMMVRTSRMKLAKQYFVPFHRSTYKDGINLIGNIKADTGLGQSCRLVANELEACYLPFSVYQYNQLGLMSNKNTQFDHKINKVLPYNINLIHINPHEFGIAFMQLGQTLWNERYNIGFWLWELEEFPEEWMLYFKCLDEIWTPSEFISNSIRKKTSLPVITIPYHVSVLIEKEYTRDDFFLPEDQFLFLMMYDRTSMTERKNPMAVITAFKEAFKDEEDVGLIIKINNCSDDEIKELKRLLVDCHHVYFITDILDRNQVNSLIKCSDAVVSLHRAEGFGLVLAEAMLLGTPVIATNWSSNTEFMTEETSCLVGYELIELKKDIGLFKKGNRWADPDIMQAAMYMQRLFWERDYHSEIADRAKQHIENHLSMERTVELINGRINEIYKGDTDEEKNSHN